MSIFLVMPPGGIPSQGAHNEVKAYAPGECTPAGTAWACKLLKTEYSTVDTCGVSGNDKNIVELLTDGGDGCTKLQKY